MVLNKKVATAHPIKSIGKWLFVLPFAAFGLLHFGPLEYSLPYIPDYLPFPAFWVYFTGICLVAFALSTVLKKLDGLAALLLGGMLLLFVLMIHTPRALGGNFLSVIAIFRDMAMAGAAFVYSAMMAKDLRYSGIKRS